MYEFFRAGCSGTPFLRKYIKNVNSLCIDHNYSTRQIVTYVLGGSLNGLIHTVTKSIPLIQKYSNKVIEEFGLQPEKLEKKGSKNDDSF